MVCPSSTQGDDSHLAIAYPVRETFVERIGQNDAPKWREIFLQERCGTLPASVGSEYDRESVYVPAGNGPHGGFQ